MAFDLDPNYKQVPERLADLKARYPDASVQPADPAVPYRIETVGDKTFVVYVAACYRTPDDPRPGIGVAWEPFPGRTPYTKDSELMNAETSAWGRAIVAALASEAKTVASAEDVRNRRAEEAPDPALLADIMDAAHVARTTDELRDAWRRAAAAQALLASAPRPDGAGECPVGEYITECRERLTEPDEAALDAEAQTIRDRACDPATPVSELAKLARRAASPDLKDRPVTGFTGGIEPLLAVVEERAAARARRPE